MKPSRIHLLLFISAMAFFSACADKMSILSGTPNITIIGNEHDYINFTGGYANTTLSWRSDRAGDFRVVANGVCVASATTIANNSGSTAMDQVITSLIPAGEIMDGANNIRICVTDRVNGKVGEATYVITRNDNAPVITLTPGYLTSLSTQPGANATATLTWQTNLPVSYQIKLNGTCSSGAALSTGANASGTIATNIPVSSTILVTDLANGSNTIRICVTDTVTAAMQDLALTITRDDTAATVTAMSPGNNLEAARSTTISVTFAKEVDATTVTSSTTTACTGSVQVSFDSFATCVAMTSAAPAMAGNTATLTPAAKLVWGNVYQIKVTATVKALSGEFVATTTQPNGFAVKGNVTTFAGCIASAGACATGSVDALGNGASFNYPGFVAVDLTGNVYVAELSNNKIRKISTAGLVTTLAGSGAAGAADGLGIAATFKAPYGIAVDGSGNVIVADQQNRKIRSITPAGNVSTLAGCAAPTSPCASGGADGTGTAASFAGPAGIAVDSLGNIYVAEGNKIRKITPAGTVSTFAGCAAPTTPCPTGADDGVGAAASFNVPNAIAIDSANNLYVSESGNRKVRKISPAGVVTTLAGCAAPTSPCPSGSADGMGTAATFNTILGIAVDNNGNVYVAEIGAQKIRKITAAGVVSTIAGCASPAACPSGGTDGIGSSARFWAPTGIAVDATGNLYVGEYANHNIRKIE